MTTVPTTEQPKPGRRGLAIRRSVVHSGQAFPDLFGEFLAVESAQAFPYAEIADRLREDGEAADFVLLVLDNEFLFRNLAAITEWIKTAAPVYTLLIVDETCPDLPVLTETIPNENLFTIFSRERGEQFFFRSLSNAFNTLYARMENLKIRTILQHRQEEIKKLTRIGIALSQEKDHDRLLLLILEKAREITRADSGSLYLVDRKDSAKLHFKLSSLDLQKNEFTLTVNKSSLAGYVALTGQILNIPDAYSIPVSADYHFNPAYDKQHNHVTRSMMVLPMKNHLNKVIGVLQLINRKRNYEAPIRWERIDDEVLPFDHATQELAMAVAGQATVAIENNQLLLDIQELFEGFIKASVSAIEARDPTTSGHSFRVADLTSALAETAHRATGGVFNAISFSSEQLREIKYASLLHDFGKIGVAEEVLVKAKKLYPNGIELIRWRVEYIKKCRELDIFRQREEYLLRNGQAGYGEFVERLEDQLRRQFADLDQIFTTVVNANEPRILAGGDFQFLQGLGERLYTHYDGTAQPILTGEEIRLLSIPKGSLDDRERREIESHVVHTYNFLRQIPWTPNLARLPEIARGHHEKLDGSGYPEHLSVDSIPVQTRMMTISDIYDALTASDRPYKKAVPVNKALDILDDEAKHGKIDPELFRLFIEARVYSAVGHTLDG